ncbi:hypothetical protein SADUNF_Sadunf08G0138300 [Salix dunnii]|uniref:C2H2-type domain-containing protein n=1 Tax=Salix dunnii TaxID=1413687 RepID=A0A835MUA4_9ROSI|nr:hypothetical protein SADUNF_Sadunf08G0138300 [Salix dunnii]
MAGFGWNLRHGNILGSKRPLLPSQIACRICDHVFTSVQALIDHTESHMIEDVEPARWKNGLKFSSRADPIANPFSFGPPTPTRLPPTGFLGHNRFNFLSLTERNLAFSPSSTPQNIASAQPVSTQQSQLSLLARNRKYTAGSQHVPFTLPTVQPKVIEEPHDIARTRPFLQQLERPFSPGVNHGKNRSYAETLDLTLKL